VDNIKIAALACSNGFGHLRRIISITTFLIKNGFVGEIDIYASLFHVNALKGWSDRDFLVQCEQVKIKDFQYPLDFKDKTKNLFDKNWEDIELPGLDEYDVVWSDNIVQVLEKRQDAILTGSFFWHEVFEGNCKKNGLQDFVYKQRRLVADVKPLMAGNEYFSTPDVKMLTEFYPVGLYRYSLLFQEKKNKGILLSCGLGGEEEDIAKEAVEKIIMDNVIPPELLLVEPRLLSNSYPKWIVKADFSSDMFQYCSAVCIRPGMGTISDSLIGRNRIFAYSNDDSFEMIHNCNVLEKLKVGQRCVDPFQAYLQALEFIGSRDLIDKQLLRTSHLRMDGVFATANLILNGV